MELSYLFLTITIPLAVLVGILIILYEKQKNELKFINQNNIDLEKQLVDEIDRNSVVISQKKSSEIRMGQVAEHLIPFLSQCKYDPKSMHFQGNPIDFIVYDLDQAEIIFLEVKTGNSKLSKRQKTIKNIIKAGKVYYEEIRVSPRGIKVRREKNEK